jgi:iron complex outermembrane receptor protein
MNIKVSRLALVTAAGFAILATPGWAQTRETESDGDAADRIVVTATKRNETISDVPISVTVVGNEVLEDAGLSTLSEIDDYIPNLTISDTPAIPIVVMRGIGSSTGSLAFEQNVSMFIDGIYSGRPKQYAAPFFDIDHIEVLRGPQGALVGKNTSAGAIVAVSAMPTSTFEASVSADYEFEFEKSRFAAIVSGPLFSDVRGRLAVQSEDQAEGYLFNSVTSTNDTRPSSLVARGILDWSDDVTSAFLKLEYGEREIEGQPFQTVSVARGIPLDFTREAGSAIGPEFDNLENFSGTFRFDRKFGEHTLTGITGYSSYESSVGLDSDYYTNDLNYSTFFEEYNQTSQEIRLSSPEGVFEYIVGAYGHVSDLFITRGTYVVTAPAATNRRYFNQSADVWSVFAEGVWHISDQWSARAGLRYTEESKDGAHRRITGANALQGSGTTAADFAQTRSENSTDPSASIQWQATPDAMFFVSYARGSKGGAFQGDLANATPANFQILPEQSDSIEGGARLTLFDGAALLNLTAFSTRYQDLQLTTTDPSITTTVSFTTRNAGEAESNGLEVEAFWEVADGVRLTSSLAYIDAAFTDFTSGQCALGQTPNGSQPGTCSYNGVTLPYAPEWNGSAALDWRLPLDGFGVDWLGNLGVRYADDTRFSSTNDPRAVQPANTKLDLRLGIAGQDRDWEVALMIRNLTDEETFSFVTTNPVLNGAGISSPDGRVYIIDMPRTVMLQTSFDF